MNTTGPQDIILAFDEAHKKCCKLNEEAAKCGSSS